MSWRPEELSVTRGREDAFCFDAGVGSINVATERVDDDDGRVVERRAIKGAGGVGQMV